jgi:cyclic pyranopterin phosphate synthase
MRGPSSLLHPAVEPSLRLCGGVVPPTHPVPTEQMPKSVPEITAKRAPDMASGGATAVRLDQLAIGGDTARAAGLGLVDGQQRKVEYLRLSVTDRCNLRCRYCMPAEGMTFLPRAEILTFTEIERLVRAFAQLGINKVRLTGGEPMLRRDLPGLVAKLAAIEGIEDISLSTNALLLTPDRAKVLADAGVSRVNISLDTLREDRFLALARTRGLDRVLAGVRNALDAGLTPVKINAVVIGGFNDDELPELVRYAADAGALLRFIEFMPIGVDDFWNAGTFVSADVMVARLEQAGYALSELEGFADAVGIAGGGPARYATVMGPGLETPQRLGFISALSHNFCASCNRVRLTATGGLQECLAFPGTLSLRDAMRQGATDDALVNHIQAALFGKGVGHAFDTTDGGRRTFQSMSVTGG